jgi:3-oxoacyl-[acyl-carrier-protein] synthase II
MSERRVAITGFGAVTPFGAGRECFREGLFQGRSAASLITAFDASTLPTRFAASVPVPEGELNALVRNQKSLKTLTRAAKFAVIAADEAVADSGLDANVVDPYRMGVSMGSGGVGLWDLEHSDQMFQLVVDSLDNGNERKLNSAVVWRNSLEKFNPLTALKALPNMIAAHLAINHRARGNCQTIANACTSATQAIGEAYRLIKAGIADQMICGGADSMIHPYGLVGFSALGVLSKNNAEYRSAARPFDRRRDGFMLGEGAAIFVLEGLDDCLRRGAEPYGEVVGYASSCDAYRLTDEPPEAWGSIQAMRRALADARLNSDQINYINAHGTGTPMNDKTETFAIKSVFQDWARSLPVSSTKSMIGHLAAAAGAVEFGACVAALDDQMIPPTINYQEPDDVCDLDYVPNRARPARLDAIMTNSFGFGGQNACLIMRKLQ